MDGTSVMVQPSISHSYTFIIYYSCRCGYSSSAALFLSAVRIGTTQRPAVTKQRFRYKVHSALFRAQTWSRETTREREIRRDGRESDSGKWHFPRSLHEDRESTRPTARTTIARISAFSRDSYEPRANWRKRSCDVARYRDVSFVVILQSACKNSGSMRANCRPGFSSRCFTKISPPVERKRERKRRRTVRGSERVPDFSARFRRKKLFIVPRCELRQRETLVDGECRPYRPFTDTRARIQTSI